MFPDEAKMSEIRQAFLNDPRIPAEYKKNARTSYEGPNYIVIGGNSKFSVEYENGTYHFRLGELFS
jgi:hypothetical protein